MILTAKDGQLRAVYSDNFPRELVTDIRVDRASTIEPVVIDGQITFVIHWCGEFATKLGLTTQYDECGRPLTTRKRAEEYERQCLQSVLAE